MAEASPIKNNTRIMIHEGWHIYQTNFGKYFLNMYVIVTKYKAMALRVGVANGKM